MSAEPLRIEELLESVADGSAVDWDALDAAASTEQEKRMVRHLRLVASIADVHRTVPLDEPAVPEVPFPADDLGIPRWGHLLLLDKIGEGAFGEVYRARDPWLDREVALKLLQPNVSGPGRVVGEAQSLARVRHPNVVTVHGADVHEGRAGLWMEFVRGRTLSEIVTSDGPLSAAEAAVAGQELCRALAAVHAAGLVHRDVKAQNVMRESGGRLVLMDFGAGHTPLYLAPELLDGAEASAATDIYALGVLLYFLVTGTYPVKGASLNDLAHAHAQGSRRRLGDARPDLPDAFVAVVERALSPDPAQRFASAREMHEAIAHTVTTDSLTEFREVRSDVGRWRAPRRVKFWLAAAALLAVLVGGVAVSRWTRSESPATSFSRVTTLAILPFDNLSGREEEAYLGQAVPYELNTRLASIGAFRVVPWTFSNKFARQSNSLSALRKQTAADAVIAGSVQIVPRAQPGGSRPVRVHVQMLQAATGLPLWDGSFERDLGDFFALQAEIAKTIAARVNVVLAQREQVLIAQVRPVQPEAMEFYLKARRSSNMYADGFKPAITLYRQAIELEPRFAEAMAGLASAYALQTAYAVAADPNEALKQGTSSSNQAIAIDPNLAEAWSARAFINLALAWDWDAASRDFAQALKLNPNSATARSDYSNYLTIVGRHEEAIQQARTAELRAPFSPVYSRKVGWAYYHARRYNEAIRQLRTTLELEPEYMPARTLLARASSQAGLHAEAIGLLEPIRQGREGMLAAVYARAGRADDAAKSLAAATGPPFTMAIANAALGRTSDSLNWLERAYQVRDSNLAHLAVEPTFDLLRKEPRFVALLERLKLR